MADSVSGNGYVNHRSPGAFAAAFAINGGMVALLIAVPVTIERLPDFGRTVIHQIDYVPPKPEPEKADKVEPRETPQKIEQRAVIEDAPVRIETPVTLSVGPQLAMKDESLLDAIGRVPVRQADPIAEPLFVNARPDPRFADRFRPDYPAAMRREGLEGDVTVRVTINESGRVIAVDLVQASNPVFFEETRRQALRSWRFVPATRDGVAVQSVQTMKVHFKLEE